MWGFGKAATAAVSTLTSWTVPLSLQKRLLRFLLKRSIGHFLRRDNLDIDNLDIELSKGQVTLKDLEIDVQTLNTQIVELTFNSQGRAPPVEIYGGTVASLTATIPLANLWSHPCVLNFDEVIIICGPAIQTDNSTSGGLSQQRHKSSSLSSSIHIAGEFLHTETINYDNNDGATHHDCRTGPSVQIFPQNATAECTSHGETNSVTSSRSSNSSSDNHDVSNNDEYDGLQVLASLINNIFKRMQIVVNDLSILFVREPIVNAQSWPHAGDGKISSSLDGVEVCVSHISYEDVSKDAVSDNTGQPLERQKQVEFSPISINLVTHSAKVQNAPALQAHSPKPGDITSTSSATDTPDASLNWYESPNHSEIASRMPFAAMEASMLYMTFKEEWANNSSTTTAASSSRLNARDIPFKPSPKSTESWETAAYPSSPTRSAPESSFAASLYQSAMGTLSDMYSTAFGSTNVKSPAHSSSPGNSNSSPKCAPLQVLPPSSSTLGCHDLTWNIPSLTAFACPDVLSRVLQIFQSYSPKTNSVLCNNKEQANVLPELEGEDQLLVYADTDFKSCVQVDNLDVFILLDNPEQDKYANLLGLLEHITRTSPCSKLFNGGIATDESSRHIPTESIRICASQIHIVHTYCSSVVGQSRKHTVECNSQGAAVVHYTLESTMVLAQLAPWSPAVLESAPIKLSVVIKQAINTNVEALEKTLAVNLSHVFICIDVALIPTGSYISEYVSLIFNKPHDSHENNHKKTAKPANEVLDDLHPGNSETYHLRDSERLDKHNFCQCTLKIGRFVVFAKATGLSDGLFFDVKQIFALSSTASDGDDKETAQWEVLEGGIAPSMECLMSTAHNNSEKIVLWTANSILHTPERQLCTLELNVHRQIDEQDKESQLGASHSSQIFMFVDPPPEDNWARMSWYDIGGREFRQQTKTDDFAGVLFQHRAIEQSKTFISTTIPILSGVYSYNIHQRARTLLSQLASHMNIARKNENRTFGSETNERTTPLSIIINVGSFQGQFAFPLSVCENELSIPSCILALKDIRIFSVYNFEGKKLSLLTAECNDVFIKELFQGTSEQVIPVAHRTVQQNIPVDQTPIISLAILFSTDGELELTEKAVKLLISGLTLKYSDALRLCLRVLRMLALSSASEQTHMRKSEDVWKYNALVRDTAIEYNPSQVAARAVLIVDDFRASCHGIPTSPTLGIRLACCNARVYIVRDSGKPTTMTRLTTEGGVGLSDAGTFYKLLGFVEILRVQQALAAVRFNELPPHWEIDISEGKVALDMCVDSYATFQELVEALVGGDDSQQRQTSIDVNWPKLSRLRLSDAAIKLKSSSLLEDIDENAFRVPTTPTCAAETFDLIDLIPSKDAIYARKSCDEIVVYNNYFNGSDVELSPSRPEECLFKASAKHLVIMCRLYEGYDWPAVRDVVFARQVNEQMPDIESTGDTDVSAEGLTSGSSSAPLTSIETFNLKANEPGRVFHGNRPSMSDATSTTEMNREDAAAQPQQLSFNTPDQLARHAQHGVEVQLLNLSATYEVYTPTAGQISSSAQLSVVEVEVLDNMRTSVWHKFLTRRKGIQLDSKHPVLRVDAYVARPYEEDVHHSELRLHVDIQPLRLFVDQDTLQFLIKFYSEDIPIIKEPRIDAELAGMSPFFQIVEIQPVNLVIDYKPKALDYTSLSRGNLLEIFNLFQMVDAEIVLPKVVLAGVKGSSVLLERVRHIYAQSIREKAIPKIVSSLSPVRALVNVSGGLVDLVLLPFEQYKKDGRVFRGVKKGAKSFLQATTLETLKIGSRLAVGSTVVIEGAEEIFGINDLLERDAGTVSKFSLQPESIEEGVASAVHKLVQAGKTLVAVPFEVIEQSTQGGVAKNLVRAIPIAVLSALHDVSRASSDILLGARNSLSGTDIVAKEGDKYK